MNKPTDFAYHLTSFLTKHLPSIVGASKNTVLSYRDSFTLLLRYCANVKKIKIEKLEIATFSRGLIEDFLIWLEAERGGSVNTRNQRLAALHSFFKYMMLEDPTNLSLYQQILAIPIKKATSTTVNYLSLDGVSAILATPDSQTIRGRRDIVLLSVMYDSGARVQEIADLVVADLRLSEPATIKLTGKGNKSRIVPLMPPTAKLLAQYIKENDLALPQKGAYPLFPNRSNQKLTRFGIRYILNKYVELVRISRPGILPDIVTPHSLRHSKAMHLHQSGVNLVYIRDLLGHSSVSVTEIYAKTDSLMKRKALESAYDQSTAKATLPSWQQDVNLLTWLKDLGGNG
jgi:site-specific recombinase XerD